jgi:hypothetical protein
MVACALIVLALCIGVEPTHQPVVDAVASAERVLWMHIPQTGGTSLALVAMKAAIKKQGKIGVS